VIADKVYTPLGQLDFAAELAKIAAAKTDAFFVFMPGGTVNLNGVNLVKQYRQAGLETIPFLSVFTVDESAGCRFGLLLGHDLGTEHRYAREQEIRH
jgi:branched-chain amino acid transport system substrate-binding protein